jgi:hypothetical protein
MTAPIRSGMTATAHGIPGGGRRTRLGRWCGVWGRHDEWGKARPVHKKVAFENGAQETRLTNSVYFVEIHRNLTDLIHIEFINRTVTVHNFKFSKNAKNSRKY